MKRILTLGFGLLFAAALCAQGIYGRKKAEIFPTDGKMRRGGLYIAPGVTWGLVRFKDKEETLFEHGDTSYTALFEPRGKLGLYLEAGWFHATNDPIILDYWDLGLAYKQLRGAEEFAGTLHQGDSVGTYAGDGFFNDKHLTLHVNANKLFQVNDYDFVQLSLGANADWRFATKHAYSADHSALDQWAFPPELIGQLHLKVGYGFKVTKRMMIIPALESPIFSIEPKDAENWGQLQWFSSKYRPLILSVRFLFLRYPKGFDCPPVKQNRFERSKVVNPSYERK